MWFKHIFLEVSKSNVIAQKLYFSLGFKKINIRSKYYSYKERKNEDAFLLKLTKL